MTHTFALRRHPHEPGPATLTVGADQGGISQIIPGVLGVNVIAGKMDSRMTANGEVLNLFHRRDVEIVSETRCQYEILSGPVQGKWQIDLEPERLVLSYELEVYQPMERLTVLSVPICKKTGWLVLPGLEKPINLDDPREAGCWHALSDAQGWALNSQGGLLMNADEGTKPINGVQIEREGESKWRVGLAFADLKTGAKVEGKISLHVVPFNGCPTFEPTLAHCQRERKALDFPTPPATPDLETDDLDDNGTMTLTLDEMPLTVRIMEEGQGLKPKTVQECALKAHRMQWEGKDLWEVTLSLNPVRPLHAARFEAEIQTPCANPSWEGDATVVIPGNFARTNFHPEQWHGGGPKYGPDPFPKEREPLVQNDEAPGCCHGWTFAGSRLPQVWTCAADRKAKRMVWMGTSPRSALGECCAGFISPEGQTTEIKITSPTTYEPWVPLGYSRMRPEARRDTAPLPADVTTTWTLWIAVEETDDLNAWAPHDVGLYHRTRQLQQEPVKLSLEEAAKICAGALHDHFYDAQSKALTYSTGPQGQHALIGFTGMSHSSLVMLWAGERFGVEEWKTAGINVLDTVAKMFLSGPGFPHTLMKVGGEAASVESFAPGSGEPGYVTMCAFDNMAEAIRREKAAGRDHPEWEKALRRCADHWIKNQSEAGAYAHWAPDWSDEFTDIDYESTNVEAGVIANMIDAYEIFGDDKYLESAKKAATFYTKDLDDGRLYGGPGDIKALVNSEVPMFYLRGYRRLYEITKDPEHLRCAQISAMWRYSFQFAHSWPVDVGSTFWKQGWAGLGMEGASSSNLHAVAFGCVNMPDEWAMADLTGESIHRERCTDLARYSVQQFARFRDDLGFPFAGAGSESFWVSDTLWGKGEPWIFQQPGFDLGYMSWVTGWAGYGALWAIELGIEL